MIVIHGNWPNNQTTYNKVYCPYFLNLTVPKCKETGSTCKIWSGNMYDKCPLEKGDTKKK